MKVAAAVMFLIGLLPSAFLAFVFYTGDQPTKVYSVGVFGPLAVLSALGVLLLLSSYLRRRIFS